MIIAAGLLVLVGLGLFVAGVLTGLTALYWACVGACVVAAVLLFLARRGMRAPDAAAPARSSTASARTSSAPTATGTTASAPTATGTTETSRGRHAGGRSAAASTAAAVPAAGTTAGNGTAPAVPASAEGAGVPASPEVAAASASTGSTAPPPAPTGATAVGAPRDVAEAGEPPVEQVEVTDLLLVVDLTDEVLVVDEHPRYHVAGCRHLAGEEAIPIRMDEARSDGFTPCGTCRPDATLADRVRAKRTSGS